MFGATSKRQKLKNSLARNFRLLIFFLWGQGLPYSPGTISSFGPREAARPAGVRGGNLLKGGERARRGKGRTLAACGGPRGAGPERRCGSARPGPAGCPARPQAAGAGVSRRSMLGAKPPGLRPAARRRDHGGRGTEAAPPRPSRPRRARRGSSAPAGAAAGAARGGAARAARSGPARPGSAAAAAATPEPVGAVREAAAGARPQRGEAWAPEAAAAAMPLLFLERFPWPSLRTYTGLSGLALLGTIVSAYRALSQPEAGPGPGEPESSTAPVLPESAALVRPSAGGPRARDVAQYLLSDSLFVWVSEAAAGRRAGGAMSPIICGGRGWGQGPPPSGTTARGAWGAEPRPRAAAGGRGEVPGPGRGKEVGQRAGAFEGLGEGPGRAGAEARGE